MKTSEFPEIICDICNTRFQPIRANQKRCSDSCRKQAAANYRANYYTPRPRADHYKPRKTYKPLKRIKKAEKVLVENMPELNRNVKNDADRLHARGIKSPDLSTIELRHYDETMRITRFFKTPERYNRFLQTLNN